MATEKRLIDADALKEIALKRGYSVRIDKYSGRWPCLLVADIANVPIVDAVEVVHGRWLPYDFAGNVKCSVCGEIFEEYNYCPNCGAKMDGGVNNAPTG